MPTSNSPVIGEYSPVLCSRSSKQFIHLFLHSNIFFHIRFITDQNVKMFLFQKRLKRELKNYLKFNQRKIQWIQYPSVSLLFYSILCNIRFSRRKMDWLKIDRFNNCFIGSCSPVQRHEVIQVMCVAVDHRIL